MASLYFCYICSTLQCCIKSSTSAEHHRKPQIYKVSTKCHCLLVEAVPFGGSWLWIELRDCNSRMNLLQASKADCQGRGSVSWQYPKTSHTLWIVADEARYCGKESSCLLSSCMCDIAYGNNISMLMKSCIRWPRMFEYSGRVMLLSSGLRSERTLWSWSQYQIRDWQSTRVALPSCYNAVFHDNRPSAWTLSFA